MKFKAEPLPTQPSFLRGAVVASAILGVCALTSVLWSAERAGTPVDRPAEIADALKKNGPIFVDWPQPQLTLIFSGETNGYLEPCGCAGLDNQLGGMKRRHTFLKELADKGWNPVALDMGGQVRRTGPQAEMKFRYVLRALIELGYSAIGYGAKDLQLSSEAILFVLANLQPEENPLVSANVDLFGMAKSYKVIETAGKRIGVTTVLGAKHQEALSNNSELSIVDPATALEQIVPQLQAENCDLNVLLVHGNPDEAAALARQFPLFNLVGTTGGAETPPTVPAPSKGPRRT